MQIDDEAHNEAMETRYGPWPWIVGFVLAAGLTYLMFAFSKSFERMG